MSTPPPPSRIGPRVRLAFPQRRDRAEIIALNVASQAFHRGWVSPPTTAEGFEELLARTKRPNYVSLAIRRRTDDAILGAIAISEIVRGAFRSAYLGYQIGAAYAGQGYMTEAVALAIGYAFGPLGLHRLEANIQPTNVPSIALVRRLGFRCEGYSPRYLKVGGRWRDHERWAILAEEWRVRRAGRPAKRVR